MCKKYLILIITLAPAALPENNPCVPSPCGPNSLCQNTGSVPSCACLPNYIGSPPNCRPECTINAECTSNLACIKEKCQDPCIGSCGVNAQCSVLNHIPICTCSDGYTGDPFRICTLKPLVVPVLAEKNPCNPTPCGPNAICDNGVCSCLPDYQGDPYFECRPECLLNSDCIKDKACIKHKCIDPCIGTCGKNAECRIFNHIPMCSCLPGFVGNAFVACQPIIESMSKCMHIFMY